MSVIFDGYEREYCELSTTLGRKCSTLNDLSGDIKSQKVKEVQNDLAEAEALIRRMDLEARSLAPEKKTPLSGVASALKGVEFIAQHIRKADKDTEVSEGGTKEFGFGGLSFKTKYELYVPIIIQR